MPLQAPPIGGAEGIPARTLAPDLRNGYATEPIGQRDRRAPPDGGGLGGLLGPARVPGLERPRIIAFTHQIDPRFLPP
jgi:hypothetical protein